MEEIKYYTSSDGKKTPIKEVNSEHLYNGYSKKIKEIFTSTNKDEYAKRLNEINDIKEEVYRRMNDFYEKLDGNDING